MVSNVWNTRYLAEYWKFGIYLALLPEHRWIRRVLAWHARRRRLGRPSMAWGIRIQNLGQWRHFGNWMFTAHATDAWQQYLNNFSILIFRWLCQDRLAWAKSKKKGFGRCWFSNHGKASIPCQHRPWLHMTCHFTAVRSKKPKLQERLPSIIRFSIVTDINVW